MIRYDPIAIYFLITITYILEQEFGVLSLGTHLALIVVTILALTVATVLLSIIADAVYHIYER